MMMPARDNPPAPRWVSAWPDALAFAAGLGMAWWFNWATRDLVWSLWLSSLAVGYAMIVWMIFGPMVYTATQAWRDRALVRERAKGPVAAVGVLYLTGGLFMLAFFTVHFGMFHFVHSVFLEVFFPVGPGMTKGFPGPALYGQVFVAYWPFVLVAAVAERQAFRWGQGKTVPVAADTSVKAADIAARKARNARAGDAIILDFLSVPCELRSSDARRTDEYRRISRSIVHSNWQNLRQRDRTCAVARRARGLLRLDRGHAWRHQPV